MQYIDSAMVGALWGECFGGDRAGFSDDVAPQRYDLCGFSRFSVQVAHQIGGNHDKKARDVVRHGIASALVVSAVLCLIGLLISHPLPGWLGGAQEIRRNATLYFMMFAIMLPFPSSTR